MGTRGRENGRRKEGRGGICHRSGDELWPFSRLTRSFLSSLPRIHSRALNERHAFCSSDGGGGGFLFCTQLAGSLARSVGYWGVILYVRTRGGRKTGASLLPPSLPPSGLVLGKAKGAHKRPSLLANNDRKIESIIAFTDDEDRSDRAAPAGRRALRKPNNLFLFL